MRKTYLISAFLGLVIAIIVGAIAPASATHALPGGASFNTGYFYGLTINSNIDPVLTHGICGDPFNSSMEDKTAFINRIMSYYSGGCTSSQNSLGAKFIMLTMMDIKGPLDIDAWKAHINDSNLGIKWVSGATFEYNSGYFEPGSKGPDDYFIYGSGSHDALVFYQKSSGSVLYQLKSNCGNPVGSTVDLQWEVIPSASVQHTANVGDNVTWTYNVVVANSAIDTSVVYGWKNTGSSTFSSSGQQGTLGSGTGVGPGATFTKTYTVQAGDAGKSLCGAAYANPGWSTNRVYRESAGACVSISAPAPNPCRPIAFTVTPRSYPAVSHTAPNGTYYHDNGGIVPVNVTINGSLIGQSPYSATAVIDSNGTNYVTRTYTTGDQYTVNFTETRSHVVSYTDVYRTVYDYGWIDYSCGTPTAPKTCKYWGVVGSHQVYDHTNTNYTGAASWSTSFGPCYDYVLNSSINDFFARLEPGSSITLVPSIGNSPYTQVGYASFYNLYHTHSKSKTTEWRITKMVIAPSATATPSTPPSAVAGSTTGAYGMSFCGRFDPTNKSTCSTFNGNTVFDVNGNPSSSINYNFTVPDVPAGTKICFAFSIYPSQSDSPNTSSSWGSNLWNHATYDPARNCIIVVKKPKTQIWGGDLWTKSSVDASNSVKSGYRFGSWGEYGILASGSISGMASGSAFAAASGLSAGSICNYSTLTFTNGANAACSNLGSYTSAHTMPSVEANFPGGTEINMDTIVVNDLIN